MLDGKIKRTVEYVFTVKREKINVLESATRKILSAIEGAQDKHEEY